MKKIYVILTSILVATLFVVSCNKIKDFGDINLDPNKPSTPFTTYLFTESCKYVQQFVLRNATNGYDPWQQEWAGYLSESVNNQYGPLSTTSNFGCSTFYLRPIKNLQYIIEMNEDEEQQGMSNVAAFGSTNNQIAVAKTLMAFYYMTISDINGPIVISDAFKGASEDNWTPKYDTQEEAYTILDNTLKDAYAKFDETSSLDASADILYGGSIAKWKKFNASLRMLMAIKLSDVDPNTGKARFAAAYKDGGMTEVGDGLDYTYDLLNKNYLYYWCSTDPEAAAGFNAVPNYFIVEEMKALKDNRMFKYFDIEGYKGSRDPEIFPRDQYSSFYGVPFGLVNNDAVSKWGDCCSSINKKMLEKDATIPVIPTSRVLLVEAEAAARGWIDADPKALYEAGIKSSFAWWGAEGADKYVVSEGVAYDAGKGIEQIALQRWIAGYLADGIEAWSDWRRLDVPHMPVGPGAVNQRNTHYPYRLPFDNTIDPEYNSENYAEAIKDLSGGTDTKSDRVWWDVADNYEGVLTDEQCTPSVVIPAKWEAVQTGTMQYGFYYYSGEPIFDDHATTLYADVNHPGVYKLSPYGGEDGELILQYNASDNSYSYACQVVGQIDGADVRAGDWDSDQGTSHADDPTYRGYYDEEEGGWLFMTIWRVKGADGKWALTAYGYDAFFPAAE